MASEAQIGPQFRRGVERQREREVAVEAALMNLVEQHRRHAGKFGIGLQAGEEHAVGHGDDPRAPCRPCCRAASGSRSSPRRFARSRAINSAAARAARRRGTSSRMRPVAPSFVKHCRRHPRRLARAGRGDQQRARAVAQGGEQVRQNGIDGEYGHLIRHPGLDPGPAFLRATGTALASVRRHSGARKVGRPRVKPGVTAPVKSANCCAYCGISTCPPKPKRIALSSWSA